MFNKIAGIIILMSAPLWGRETWRLSQTDNPAMFLTMLIAVMTIATGIALTTEEAKK